MRRRCPFRYSRMILFFLRFVSLFRHTPCTLQHNRRFIQASKSIPTQKHLR